MKRHQGQAKAMSHRSNLSISKWRSLADGSQTSALTRINLNIAEGSTSSSDAEQARFLSIAIRSLVETVTCQHLINRRGYLTDPTLLRQAYQASEKLFIKLQAMRKALSSTTFHELTEEYKIDDTTSF